MPVPNTDSDPKLKEKDQAPGHDMEDDQDPDPEGNGKELKPNRSAEDYAKRLVEVAAENKSYRKKANELKDKLDAEVKKRQELENEKLQSEGKFKELAESKTKEADEWKKKAIEKDQAYAYKVISGAVKIEAIKRGCKNVDHLIKLLDLSELETDDDYNIKSESLKSLMDLAVKEIDYLFKKSSAKVIDGTPVDEKPEDKKAAYHKELSACKTQRELDAVRLKYGKG